MNANVKTLWVCRQLILSCLCEWIPNFSTTSYFSVCLWPQGTRPETLYGDAVGKVVRHVPVKVGAVGKCQVVKHGFGHRMGSALAQLAFIASALVIHLWPSQRRKEGTWREKKGNRIQESKILTQQGTAGANGGWYCSPRQGCLAIIMITTFHIFFTSKSAVSVHCLSPHCSNI